MGRSLGGYLAQLFVLDFASEVQNFYTFQAPLKDVKNKAYIQKISYHFHTCDDFKKYMV